jgi:NAD-dependent dihydropyrimidine dehydrogenase PreA subunit
MNVAYYIGGAIVALWLIGGIYRQKRKKNKIIHVVDDNCTGCKRCVTNMRKCKRNVLELVTYDNGTNHIEVKYPDKCTACGDCVGLCKFNALELIEKAK